MTAPFRFLFLILPIVAHAAPVSVGDHSFESNALASGGWTNDLSPEWLETGGANNGSGFEEYINGFFAHGTDHLGLNSGHNVWQDLATTYASNTTYTLTVAVGNRAGQTAAGNQSIYSLRDPNNSTYASASANASAIAGAGNFADAPPLTFDTSTNPAAVGETIRIHLSAGNSGRTHFDHIRLDATPNLPDGTAQLTNGNASAITDSSATIGGTVTDIGDDAPTITLFYGPTDGGTDPGTWASSLNLPGTHSSSFSGAISGLNPAQEYFFAARATNSGGSSWATPSSSFETLPALPTVTQSASSSVTATSAGLSATITDTGGDLPTVVFYYGTSDGGTTTGNWTNSISLGQTSSTVSTTLTGLNTSTTYFFRARATNAAGSSWSPSSASFTTTTVTPPSIVNRDPANLTGTSASLRGEVTDNGSDTPTVTLYYGTTDGGTTPGSWQTFINVGPENGNFSRFVSGLTPETTYFFTSRATNLAGTAWAPASATFTTPAALPSSIVINEIHYDPLDETSAEEFIELYNPGSQLVDLSGWQLTDAVTFTFPSGTTIAPGDFVIIAQDPSRISTVFGKTALGPWTGSLNNQGEEIDLRDPSGTLQDQVNYDAGFPWPTGARGGGGSMELLNPALDNDLSGSWRVSGTTSANPSVTTFVPEADTDWHYRKGTSEASSPVSDWRQINFTEDGSWLTGQAPFGFGDNDDNTVLSDMQGSYSSVYLRQEFTVDPLNIPQQLTLRVYVDDGAIIWINGDEVERTHVDDGQIPFDGTGNNHEAAWEEFTIPAAGNYLVGGTNVIAIHALNVGRGSSDFSIDASLTSGSSTGGNGTPTPGAFNSSFSTLTPPAIRQVDHSPEAPTDSDPVTITAKITDPEGMGPVTLDYQTVDPGSYIRQTDPLYDTSWTTVTMVDDGTSGDLLADDSIYTVVLPASLQNHRRLVRYRIHFEDSAGASDTAPYADDKQPNFAYFCYNGTPSWAGSFTPTSATETFPPELMGSLPTYHLIANSTDVTNSQYSGGSDGVHFSGTLVYDGKVYDHIEFENRGEASTYVSGKNKWRMHFNRARRFAPRDNWGEKYGRTWSKLNLQSISSPWAAVNRGMAGLDESLTMRLYGLAGIPSPRTHYFSFRVIDSASETNPSDQYSGDLWGLYLAMEQPNGSFLDERNLPDGNIYKIEGGSGDKKEQGNTQVTNSSDWSSFYSASNSAQTEQWWRDNMHMPGYYSMRSLNRLLGNVDIRIGYNHYFYHEPTLDQWHVMPWDLDMMYIAETHQAGVIRQQNSILNHSQLAIEFRNRAREILDLVASNDSPTGGQIGQLVDEYADIVNPTGQTHTWADVDAFMWNYHPRTNGSPGNASGQTNHKGNFYASPFTDSRFGGTYQRTLISEDHEGYVNHIINYTTDTFTGGNWSPGNGIPAGYGYEYLNDEADDPNIPNKPTLAYTGPAGFPVNGLSFSSGTFSDPNSNNSFGKMRWRIAKILAPGLPGYQPNTPRTYEIETVATSPEILSFNSAYQFSPDPIQPGATYRVRVQHEDSTGRTSHWSDPVEFLAAAPSTTLWSDHLVISEIMYNPPQPNASESLVSTNNNDFEFIELTNISSTITLDLTGLDFSAGITFDFATASLTALAPGASVLLVKNQAAFEARYGTGLPVIGTYPNSLSNGGEQITLSFAQNTPIIDFIYGTASPWPSAPDGGGVSLILINPTSGPDHSLAANWTAGIQNGTPGTPEPEGLSYSDWLADNFTPGELGNPAISGENADPDNDGISNLLEYALFSDPQSTDPLESLITSSFVEDGGQTYFTFTYRQRTPAPELTYIPQISTGLQTWREGPSHLVEFSNVDHGNGSSTVTVRSTSPFTIQAREFARLKVIRSAP
ncbi:MAG: lamin tail domain-containing protein [Verrucomicrobiaceae bacterium]